MQTTYTNVPTEGRCGLIQSVYGGGFSRIVSSATLTSGLLAEEDQSATNLVKALTALPAADDDSIATALASAAAPQVFRTAAALDGVIGLGRILPMQVLTYEFNNHADWLASRMWVFGIGPDKTPVVEVVNIPANGNVTITGKQLFSEVDRIHLDTQGGVNGTIKVGTDPTYNGFNLVDYGVVGYHSGVEWENDTYEYVQYDDVTLVKRGRLYVTVEAAVSKGDPVFVRTVAAGADVRGQFRGDYAANFSRVYGAYFVNDAATDALAIMQLGE